MRMEHFEICTLKLIKKLIPRELINLQHVKEHQTEIRVSEQNLSGFSRSL